MPELEIPVGKDEQEAEENVDVLEGMRCPECGSLEPFRISVSHLITVWDTGVEWDSGCGDNCWDDDSVCVCAIPECGFEGTVRDFREENQGGE